MKIRPFEDGLSLGVGALTGYSSRRIFLKTMGLLTLMTGCASTVAVTSIKKPKGPRVWLDMDQEELDAAYNQGVWAPNRAEVLARYKTNSEAVRARVKPPQRIAYGAAAIESLDIYTPEKPNGKIHIFIHGGAWAGGNAAEYAFLVEPLLQAGVIVVIPDFSSVQDVSGNLTVLADQVRRSIAFVYQQASQFGGDKEGVYLSGHSSGGHLAAVAMTTDWSTFSQPSNVIRGGLICSGMYDLKPVRLSARSKYITFTDEMEDALSPQRHLGRLQAPMIIVYGSKESPEFQRQARDFTSAGKKAGKDLSKLEIKDLNHFEVLETMCDPGQTLGRAFFKQMGLKV